MPDIAIITPAYIDTEEKTKWLEECVNSVIEQTFQEWEMIIVDDSSPIRISDYNDPRVKVVRATQRSYPSLCRNTAVGLSEADAILPLDSDDLLFNQNVLVDIYDVWKGDRKKVVYGNMTILDRIGQSDNFSPVKSVEFPSYSFEYTLDLRGIIPVTALHSKECHIKSGGWKEELKSGLEDVEYWISAGKAGFCGIKIPIDVFFYRKHGGSRTNEMRNNNEESIMRSRIRELHNDVFSGRYPMSCCGGGKPQTNTSSPRPSPLATDLSAVSEDNKVWVKYIGKRRGSWGIIGRGSGLSYQINGEDFTFQVHSADVGTFRSVGRGKDFQVGAIVAPKSENENRVEEYVGESPKVIMIERMPSNNGDKEYKPDELEFDLTLLGLNSSLTDMLIQESWSIQDLARCDISDLMPYKGIGKVTAESIKETARQWLEAIT